MKPVLKPVPWDQYFRVLQEQSKSAKAHSRIYSIMECAWEDITDDDGNFKGMSQTQQIKWYNRLKSIVHDPATEPAGPAPEQGDAV